MSEPEQLQAIHGIPSVFAQPTSAFNCGKCGAHNTIPSYMQTTVQYPQFVDCCRHGCRVLPPRPVEPQPESDADRYYAKIRAERDAARACAAEMYSLGFRSGVNLSRDDGFGWILLVLGIIAAGCGLLTLLVSLT